MNSRKWLSFILAMVMLFTCIPTGMMAEGEETEPVAVEEKVEVQPTEAEPAAPAEPVKEEKKEAAPAVEEKKEAAPAVEEKKEEAPKESAPVVEEKKEEKPVEPAPAVEEAKEEAPVEPAPAAVEEKEEAPAVEEKEIEAPVEEVPATEEQEPEKVEEETPAVEEEAQTQPEETVPETVEEEEVPEDETVADTVPAVEEPAPEAVEEAPAEDVDEFAAGLAKLTSGDVYKDDQLRHTYGKVSSEGVVYAVKRVTGEGSLDKNDVIQIAANVEGEIKTLYVKNGRLTYLDEADVAKYLDAKHENGIDYRNVKLDPVNVTIPQVEEPAEVPAVEEPAEEPAVEEPAEEPAVEEPAEEPAIEEPTEEPAVEEPAEEPAVEEPAVEPAVEEPAEEPVAEPAVEEPVNEPAEEPVEKEVTEENVPVEEAIEENPENGSEAEEDQVFVITLDRSRLSSGAQESEVTDVSEAVTLPEETVMLAASTALEITGQPEDAVSASDMNVKFKVVAVNAVAYKWQFSKDNGATWTNCGSLYAGRTTDTLTVKASAGRNGWLFRCVVTGADLALESNPAMLTVVDTAITGQPENVVTLPDVEVTFTVVASEAETYKWQFSKDEGATWTNCGSLYTGRLTDTLTVKASAARNGWMFRCVVTGNGITLVSDPALLTISEDLNVEITKQPEDVATAPDTSVTFSVTAENAESYKWQFSNDNGTTWTNCGSLYAGRTTDTVTVKASSGRNGWLFRCLVTGNGVTLESDPATLTVSSDAQVEITKQPEDVTTAPDTSVTFSVTAENAESYKWQFSNDNGTTWTNCGSLYAGRTTDTVTVKASSGRNGWLFRCLVTGNGVTLESDPATLTVSSDAQVEITKQPEDVTTAPDTNVTFSVTAENAESYKWQFSNDNGATWTNCGSLYAGRTTDTVTVKASSGRNGWLFRCLVTGNGVTLESDPATLTVSSDEQVEITKQPEDVTTAADTNVTFTVVAENAETYKWQFSKDEGATWTNCGSLYEGRTTDTLTVKASSGRNGWQFRCLVTGNGTTVESAPATLTVSAEQVTIVTQPEDVTADADTEVTFTVVAENAETYKWQFSKDEGATWTNCGSLYEGRTTDTLTVKASSGRNGWMFRCVVTGGGVELESDPALLTVNTAIVVDGVKYEKLTDTTLVVVSYEGSAASLTIPEQIEGLTVTQIGESAFEGNTALTSIDLPDTITVIGKKAFKNCTNLSEMK